MEASTIRLDLLQRLAQSCGKENNCKFERIDGAGYIIHSIQDQLTFKVGPLVSDLLIKVHYYIQKGSYFRCTSAGPSPKKLKLGLLMLDHNLIGSLVPVDLKKFVSTDIISRDPEAKTHWEGIMWEGSYSTLGIGCAS